MFKLFSFANKQEKNDKNKPVNVDEKQKKLALSQINNNHSQINNPYAVELCKNGHCFILMRKNSDILKFDIESLFSGKFNKTYSDNFYFDKDCPIYPTIRLASKYSTLYKTTNQYASYIMVIGCSEEKVKELAGEGKFHTAIVRAINAKQFNTETCGYINLLNENKRKKIEVIENPAFDRGLLTASQSSDDEVNFQL